MWPKRQIGQTSTSAYYTKKKDLALRIAPEIKQGLKESNTMVVGKKNIIYFTTTTFCAGRLSTLTK